MTENLPTIGIDCRFMTTQSGIGRYTRELVTALKRRNDPWRYVFLESDIKHYSLNEQIKMPSLIKKHRIDLMHFPHFNVPLRCPVPFITTIHDLILHHYPNQASILKRMAYKKLMKHAVKKSAHIITVSNFTASDITKTYGDNIKKKITVTYEGVSPQFKPASESEINRVCAKYNLPTSKQVNELTSKQSKSFILYVGTSKQHKNVQTLIDAVSDKPLVLVTSGKEVSKLKLTPNVTIIPEVDDTDLPALYSVAKCFITASLYEGFGLPALEAMACGCPVMASNRGSLPEILGEGASFVEPTVDKILEGIERTQDTRHKTCLSGRQAQEEVAYANSFSWEKMAEETALIYERILNSSDHISAVAGSAVAGSAVAQ